MQNLKIVPVTSCTFGGGRFEVSDKGVHFFGIDKEGKEQPPQWICSPLHVVAKTRDEKNGEWGRLLEWQDDDGKKHQWAMPLELLEGDGSEVRRELARMGLHISPNPTARNLLAAYVKVWPVEDRALCVDRLGWHKGIYVTPMQTIGNAGEHVVFQNSHAVEPAFSTSGTEHEWRDSVAALAQGNSRLVLAISAAFAGPLADIAGEDSGGFHFRGASSSGKSTTLNLAASIWGNPKSYVRSWRSTTNGLEGLATLHNDGLLILDEISQVDPNEVGNAAYLLANGQGKSRATRNGLAREPQRWRLLFLSAGEESLSAIMERAGKKSSAGQEIRLADIAADAGAGMGIFEELYGYPSPAALALEIKDVCAKYHGTAGIQWLNHIVENREKLAEIINEKMKQFVDEVTPKNATGQVSRVARRFALVAIAGELATLYGLTGWDADESTNSARRCFAAWLEGFGGNSNREERAILEHIRAFIETHGASRFEHIDAQNDQRISNRVGFYRVRENGSREYLIPTETFRREVCRGLDFKTAVQVLKKSGLLIPAKDGKPSHVVRLPGLGTPRVYVIQYIDEAD